VARFTSTVDTIAYGFKVARASSEERASLYDLDVALQPNFLGVDLIEHCRQRLLARWAVADPFNAGNGWEEC
jgi:hypothetical protein